MRSIVKLESYKVPMKWPVSAYLLSTPADRKTIGDNRFEWLSWRWQYRFVTL